MYKEKLQIYCTSADCKLSTCLREIPRHMARLQNIEIPLRTKNPATIGKPNARFPAILSGRKSREKMLIPKIRT